MSPSRRTQPAVWHTQDWILVLEALVLFTQHWPENGRVQHAEWLIEEIAMEQEALPSELLLQIDDQYSHRERTKRNI